MRTQLHSLFSVKRIAMQIIHYIFKSFAVFGASIIITLSFVGCETDIESWQKAKTINTVDAYQNHLKAYPSSIYVDSAKAEIAWLETIANNTYIAYENFKKLYPNSKYLKDLDIKMIWVTKILDLDCTNGEFEYMYNDHFDWNTDGNIISSRFMMKSSKCTISDNIEILLNDKKTDCSAIERAKAIQVILINGKVNTLQLH